MTDVFDDLAKAFKAGFDVGRSESADEIEWMRKENQELKLQYLSDQGQWIEETGRLREALREIAKTDIQTWAKTALEKGDWVIVERIAEVDQQGTACRALAGEKDK